MRALEFFFGKPCANCKRGWYAKRWTRYDGTGSWRMHERGSIMLDNDESFYCERNGWFSRHRFLTIVIMVYGSGAGLFGLQLLRVWQGVAR